MQQPEIIYDLSFADYQAIDAINASRLKFFAKTPLHARHALLHDKPDVKELVIGHAAHTMVLEPEKFNDTYAIFDDEAAVAKVMRANPDSKNPKATTIYKDAKAVWEAKHAGHVHLTATEYDRCRAIQAAVKAHPIASQLFYGGPGENELSIVWPLATGDKAKARIDRLTTWNGFNCIVDLKTWNPKATDAVLDQRSVSRQVHQFGYHNQAAWYLDGMEAADADANEIFLFVFVEQEAPHDVCVFELSQEAIERGRAENATRFETWKACEKSGKWPGVSNEVCEVGLPAYA